MACKGSLARIDPAVARLADTTPRHLCLEAGVAYLVVVGEDGACRCPFGVRRQKRIGRLSGTTALPPRHDKTHQPPNPREHLFHRLGLLRGCYVCQVASGVLALEAAGL
jgi:hypothetical protein